VESPSLEVAGGKAPHQKIKYAYLHGYASGPFAVKGLMLRSCFEQAGLKLELPDLNKPSLSELTFTAALHELDEMHSKACAEAECQVVWRLVGPSMGGYLAARWAELHPSRVERLVLLSPALDFASLLPSLVGGQEAFDSWRRKGFCHSPGPDGWLTKLHWDFAEDVSRHPPVPSLPCPTLALLALRDALLPPSAGHLLRLAARRPDLVRVESLDDDHAMIRSMPTIVDRISAFFGLDPGLPAPPPPPSRQVSQLDHNSGAPSSRL